MTAMVALHPVTLKPLPSVERRPLPSTWSGYTIREIEGRCVELAERVGRAEHNQVIVRYVPAWSQKPKPSATAVRRRRGETAIQLKARRQRDMDALALLEAAFPAVPPP